jgi:serine acetyltransferase
MNSRINHIDNYLIFTSSLYGTTRTKKNLILDYRFLAGYLVFISGKQYHIPKVFKKLFLFFLRLIFGIESTDNCYFNGIPYFPHPRNIIIGARFIGKNVIIYHNTTLGAKRVDYIFNISNRPKLNDGCVIATGAVVLGGGVILENKIVKANEVKIVD